MIRLIFTLFSGVISPVNNAYGFWFLSFYLDHVGEAEKNFGDAKSLFAVLYEDGKLVIDLLFTRIVNTDLSSPNN